MPRGAVANETTKVPLAFPLGGVNRNLPRSFQPPGTTWDALNTLPYDRWGRARGGQRPGTSKLWAAAIGAPNGPVQLLQQTTLALDPSTISANTLLGSDNFNGLAAGSNLSAVDANWVTYDSTPSVNAARLIVTAAGNSVRGNGTLAQPGFGLWQPSAAIGTVYILRCTITPGATAGNQLFHIFTRMNKGAPTSTAVTLHLSLDNVTTTTSAATCKIYLSTDINSAAGSGTPTPSFTFAANAFNSLTSYTFEMQVNGDNIRGFINGIPYVNIVTSTNSGQLGVGFGIGSGTTASIVDDWFIYTGQNLSSYRQNNIVAVDGGDVYVGDISTQATLATNGTDALSSNAIPNGASLFGVMYFVDGFSDLKQLDLATRTVSTPTITGGTGVFGSTSETATTLGRYMIAAAWRGRLVLGADRLNPQNFVMSKSGTPINFDYSDGTAISAFAGNASLAGKIGDPITALIPYSDDILIIGGDHTLWVVKGDPADGGSIDIVSDAIGILGPRAWCKTPEGVIYFAGTGGLFRMTPGGEPENVSNTKYNQFFANINRGTSYVQLAWDRDRHGCYVFVTPVSTGAATHIWFDARTDGGFWPLQYPNDMGPISVLVYDGDGATDRRLLLGGRSGYVQIMTETSRNDDGTAISSYVFLGPIQPYPPDGEAVLVNAIVDLGEVFTGDSATVWNVNFTWRGGKTAYDVTEGTPDYSTQSGYSDAGYEQISYPRIRGRWLAVKVENGLDTHYWSFERAILTLRPGGKQR